MKTLQISLLLLLQLSLVLSLQAGQKASLTAHDDIRQQIQRLFSATDARDWAQVEASFAAQVTLDYSSLAGGEPSSQSPAEIVAGWQQLLPGFESTHHQIGQFDIRVERREATAHFRGIALHYLSGQSWTVTGSYDLQLQKQGATWLVREMHFNLEQMTGDQQLPARAMDRVRKGTVNTVQPIDQAKQQVVERFFTALEAMDIPAFMQIWAQEGVQVMPLSPKGFPSQLSGAEAIYNQYKSLPEHYSAMQFPRSYHATADSNTLIVQYGGIIPLADGSNYNNNYVGVFEVVQGKIQRFTEYFDPYLLTKAFGMNLQENFNVTTQETTTIQTVHFTSEGLELVGHLHLPASFDESRQYQGIVVTGSWTTVKEMMPDGYAAKLAEQGFVALTFDFRNYGESEGMPRNLESPALKATDISHAAQFLQRLPYIDAAHIGGMGICASAGYMVQAVTEGAPIHSINLVAPWLHNATIVEAIYGGAEGVAKLKQAGIEARARFEQQGEVQYVLAASETDETAVMFGPWDYYLNPERGAIAAWGNQFAVMAWPEWLNYDPISLAGRVDVPLQIIHSQQGAVPMGAAAFYEGLKTKKNIIWVEGASQFDFYDQEPYTTDATVQAAAWFNPDHALE